MDVNKNSYTFLFAFVLVVVVAALLSFAATALKPAQQENIRLEKMQSILSSINEKVDRNAAGEVYAQFIVEEVVVRNGKPVSGVKAFDIDLAKELDKAPEERNAPLYVAEKDGQRFYIIPVRGKGLWGPIWGYLSLEDDANTVYGATFDHKSETPGLGAEINTEDFTKQFKDKKMLMANGEFTGIKVTKKAAVGEHQVDGISGGTITSVGVEDMITDCMQSYIPYLKETANIAFRGSAQKELATLD